jgi:hypothetical protein
LGGEEGTKRKTMKMIVRNFITYAALLSGWLGTASPASDNPAPPKPVHSDLFLGRWKVQFANGVNEVCRISKNGLALISEPHRTAVGTMEARGASVLIFFRR